MILICPYCQNNSVSIARDGKSTRKCNRCFKSWLPAFTFEIGCDYVGDIQITENANLVANDASQKVFGIIFDLICNIRREIIDNNPLNANMSSTREAVLMTCERIITEVNKAWTAYEYKPEAHNQ